MLRVQDALNDESETPTLTRLLAQYQAREFECNICFTEPLFWRDEYETGGCRECVAEVMESIADLESADQESPF